MVARLYGAEGARTRRLTMVRTASPRVLLLGREPESGLRDYLQTLLAEAEVEPCDPSSAEWGTRLVEGGVELLIAETNAMSLAEMRLLSSLLRPRRNVRALLIVGDRGLAGAEDLLELANVRVLPEPWTPAGLEKALGIPAKRRAAKANSAASLPQQEFLAGVVEGLRDPLASLSGYLQLLTAESGEGSAPSGNGLVGNALESAREMDRILDALHLASGQGRRRALSVDLQEAAQSAIEEADRDGRNAVLRWTGRASVQGDPRLLQAALYASRLFLDRFGPGGELTLDAQDLSSGLELAWEVPPPSGEADDTLTPPPNFLPVVLDQLAVHLDARSVLQWHRDAIPVRVGLRWPDYQPVVTG